MVAGSDRRGGVFAPPALIVLGLGLVSVGARAQEGQPAVFVDGVVRETYRNERDDRPGSLLVLEVRRSELGPGPRGAARVAIPAPGDLVYVHVPAGSTRLRGRELPPEAARLRLGLRPRAEGGWEIAATDGLQPIDDAAPYVGRRPGAGEGSGLEALGVTVEETTIQGRSVLRVTGVERGGPAHRAGLEPGDTIVGVDGQPLGGAGELAGRVRRGGTMQLMVVDIHTGRSARVNVELGARAEEPAPPAGGRTVPTPAPEPRPAPAGPAPTAPRRSLGISAEAVSLGQRTALKVVRVEPGGAGARAGLEPGDVIVAVNGAAVTGIEQFAAALRKSGPVLDLTVRDTRTGKDIPVRVALEPRGAPPADRPAAPPAEPGGPAVPGEPGATPDRLGVVTELVFLDVDPAVKVSEVAPGSPAARAGLEVGDIIVTANDKPVLHPNELTEAVRQSDRTLTLSVIKPGDGRKTNVEVDLGRR